MLNITTSQEKAIKIKRKDKKENTGKTNRKLKNDIISNVSISIQKCKQCGQSDCTACKELVLHEDDPDYIPRTLCGPSGPPGMILREDPE